MTSSPFIRPFFMPRPLLPVASMRAATSAKDGKFIALSIWGSGPFIPEIVKRRDHEGVKVHLSCQPAKDCGLLDRTAWEAANPGLGFIKSSTYMEHEAKRAKSTPSDEAFFRAQDLNLPGCRELPERGKDRLPFGLGSVRW